MFLKPSVFKKMCNEEWKGKGLSIQRVRGYYAVAGEDWLMEVSDTRMTPKVRSILCELAGELPGMEVGCLLFRKKKEPMLSGNIYENLLDEYKRTTEAYETTNIIFRTATGEAAVLQEETSRRKCMVDDMFMQMIDITAVEAKKGERAPMLPRCNPSDEYIIWANNVMAMKVKKQKEQYVKEKHILDLLGPVDAVWAFINSETLMRREAEERKAAQECVDAGYVQEGMEVDEHGFLKLKEGAENDLPF